MFEDPNRTMSANHTPGPVRDLHWREALANDMLASGLMIPVEHITTVGVRYLCTSLRGHRDIPLPI